MIVSLRHSGNAFFEWPQATSLLIARYGWEALATEANATDRLTTLQSTCEQGKQTIARNGQSLSALRQPVSKRLTTFSRYTTHGVPM